MNIPIKQQPLILSKLPRFFGAVGKSSELALNMTETVVDQSVKSMVSRSIRSQKSFANTVSDTYEVLIFSLKIELFNC